MIMTIHVNIGEAKAQLSKLIAASLRGEDVVIDHAGEPKVRLTPVAEVMEIDRAERRKRVDAILARIDALPLNKDIADPLQWDENGLPI
jgi:prevent-host-death family protein